MKRASRTPEAAGQPAAPAVDLPVLAEDVSVRYRTTSGASVSALEGFSLAVDRKEFVAIIGPSGCGKSTFLRAVADLVTADVSGTLRVGGRSPREARLQHAFAFVFQDPVLLPWRTVMQNVLLPAEMVPNAKAEDAARLIELMGLSGFEGVLPKECSGGMRSRVSIARALMLRPELLLMDEPFAAVDEITRDRLQLALQDIWMTTDASALFITHSLEEAAFLADRVVVMTSTPGRLKGIVDIPFERPRQLDLRKSVELLEKENEVRELLEAEYAKEA